MKRIALVIVIIIFAPHLSEGQDVGAVGDVKYSVLEPSRFVEVNGEGWVLMDGRQIEDSALQALSGISELPDARGLFIRSDNAGRTEGGDPEENRALGSYQADALKRHNVQYRRPQGPGLVAGCGNCAGVYHTGLINEQTTAGDGPETRPQNINLYTYIKIN